MGVKQEIIAAGKMTAGVMVTDLAASSFMENISQQNQAGILRAEIVGAIGVGIIVRSLIDLVRHSDGSMSSAALMRSEDEIILVDYRNKRDTTITEERRKKSQAG